MTESPSWEEVLTGISISSNHVQVASSGQRWTETFRRLEMVAERIRTAASRSRQGWTGEGAEAFRDHLEKIAKAIDDIVRHHRSLGPGLHSAAEHLRTATGGIPIPPFFQEEVQSKQGMYSANGGAHDIAAGRVRQYLDENYPHSPEANLQYIETHGGTARSAYQTLVGQYAGVQIPQPTRVSAPAVRAGSVASTTGSTVPKTNPLTTSGLGQTGLGMPMSGMPMGGLPMGGLPIGGLPSTGLPGGDLPSTELPELPELPELEPLPDTGGLAGAGPLGSGGFGGGGLGIGGGGFGGGIPLPDLGPTAQPSAAMTAGQALSGAPTRGTTQAGGITSSTAASAMGMAPMGMGPHGPTGGETTTQLYEDDKQIFGPGDQDLPSGVLD